jgi:hypothetical protein
MAATAFEVVTVATGRNSPQGIRRFFEETGVENLPILLDPRQDLSREMGVFGLPVTVLIDAEGQEIARMVGEADWAGDKRTSHRDALIAAQSPAE